MLGARRRPLVTFEDATFTRNSVAWYSKTPTLAIGSMVQAAANEARIRTVAGIREYLSENSRSNQIQGSSSRHDSASWSSVGGSGASITSEAVDSVFDGELADTWTFPGTGSINEGRETPILGTADGDTVVVSAIVWTDSGTAPFDLWVLRRTGIAIATSFTATTTPQLFYFAAALDTGASIPAFRIRQGTDGLALGTSYSINVAHVQVETYTTGRTPTASSPIRKDDGAIVTREADAMEFPAFPQPMIDGVWSIRWRPLGDNSEVGWSALVHQNANGILRATAGTVRMDNTFAGNNNISRSGITYSAGQPLDIFLDHRDAGNSAIRVEGATTGDGTSSGALGQLSQTAWYLGHSGGGYYSGQANMVGWLTEPRLGKALV